jgi:hypothetical protein
VQSVVVKWRLLSRFLFISVGLYFVSFILAKRPIAALWRLSGEVRYFDRLDRATPFAIFDYMIVVATGTLLVGAAARRMTSTRPDPAEVTWLVLLSAITLGSGARSRLYVIFIGWLLIQYSPHIATRRGLNRAFAVAAAALVVLMSLVAAGSISELRSRTTSTRSDSTLATGIRGLDVIGSSEVLFANGARPGMLRGQSYLELPALLLPRKIVGPTKANPAADELMRSTVNPVAGLAAPLWIESTLNFGSNGTLVFGSMYAWIATRSLCFCRRARGRFGLAVSLMGPVWVLVGYLVLSRLTIFQLLVTVGALLGGAVLASRTLTLGGSIQHHTAVRGPHVPTAHLGGHLDLHVGPSASWGGLPHANDTGGS